MDKPVKVIVAFIGVFIAGAIFGGVFTFRASARRQPPPQRPLTHLPPEGVRAQVAGPQVMAQPGAAARTNPITPQLMRNFTKSLSLSPEQREKLQPIVSRAGEDFQRLREEEARRRQENLADVARVNERMYVDVSGLLTSDQRVQLQEMRQRIEDRMQAERQRRAEAAAAEAANRTSGKMSERAAAKQAPENPK